MPNAIAYLMLKWLLSFPVHGRVTDQGRVSPWTSATATASHIPTWALLRMGLNTSIKTWESTEWPQPLRTAWGSRPRFFSYTLLVSSWLCLCLRSFILFLMHCSYVSLNAQSVANLQTYTLHIIWPEIGMRYFVKCCYSKEKGISLIIVCVCVLSCFHNNTSYNNYYYYNSEIRMLCQLLNPELKLNVK